MKRALDFIISLFALIILSPLFLFVSLVILISDGKPILFRQERVGRNNELFTIYKFRTMKRGTENVASGALENANSKITKFGKILRATSIDELPQVINILKGEMSFIGPRPDTPMYIDKYTEEEKIILTVRPGVTGYNQAINRNSVLTKEKLKNDVYYAEHLSLWFDIKIIFMSLVTVLGHKNVNRIESDSADTYILKDSQKDPEEKELIN